MKTFSSEWQESWQTALNVIQIIPGIVTFMDAAHNYYANYLPGDVRSARDYCQVMKHQLAEIEHHLSRIPPGSEELENAKIFYPGFVCLTRSKMKTKRDNVRYIEEEWLPRHVEMQVGDCDTRKQQSMMDIFEQMAQSIQALNLGESREDDGSST